jgi:hypothetical protein
VKLIIDMTEPELRSYFNRLARNIEDQLPPGPSARGKCMFVLLVTDTLDKGLSQYVSNAQRDTIVALLRETADRLENREDVTR